MALLEKLPRHLFTLRGWGMLAAGAFTLAAAQVMGRRDLLTLQISTQSSGLKLYVPVQLKLGPPGPPNGRDTAAVAWK